MKEQNLASYVGSEWAKCLLPAEGKIGKTTGLIASALGLFPWQTRGGIVSAPEHLHIISCDADALGGALRFLTKSCGADPNEVGKIHVLNMQDDLRKVNASKDDYSGEFFGTMCAALDSVRARSKSGVHVMLISSLTGFAAGLLRALSGGPKIEGGKMKKSSMDQNKWAQYAMLLSDLQMQGQIDGIHTFWEAHLHKTEVMGEDGKPAEKDSLLIQGRQGGQWSYNVEQILRYRRLSGQKHPGTNVDKCFFDTRPSLGFIANGRGFNELLAAQEHDLTEVFEKLGLRVGGWKGQKISAVPVSNGAPKQSPRPVVRR